ncbi:hypothetical protein F4604DRAFT_1919130 [Suillus subluteus]|nr:hypothetical protein F4604DRAFT_1919130 [Suillus subluteus]
MAPFINSHHVPSVPVNTALDVPLPSRPFRPIPTRKRPSKLNQELSVAPLISSLHNQTPSPPDNVTVVKVEPFDNFTCRNCKQVGHCHKNCPTYYCRVCRDLAPRHLSVFCKDLKGVKPIPLVWTDEGFYEALSKWEAEKDDAMNRVTEEEDDIMFRRCISAGDLDGYNYHNLDC